MGIRNVGKIFLALIVVFVIIAIGGGAQVSLERVLDLAIFAAILTFFIAWVYNAWKAAD